MSAIKLIEQWHEVQETGDIGEISKFLFQHCQEAMRLVESQDFVIGCLNEIINEKNDEIDML